MNSQRLGILLGALKCIDLLLMAACLIAACLLTCSHAWDYSFRDLFLVQVEIHNVVFFVYVIAIWAVVLSVFRMYDLARFLGPRNAGAIVVKATFTGALVLYAFGSLFRVEAVTPVFVSIFWVSVTALTLSTRLAICYSLSRTGAGDDKRHNVLVVGTNRHAINCVREIEGKSVFGYRPLGFVDDRSANNNEYIKTGYEIVADFDELPQYLRSHVVDEVVICLPMKSFYQKAAWIVDRCEEQGVIVRHTADLFNHKVARPLRACLEGEPLITFFNGTMSEWRGVVKRGIDIIISSVLLIATSPIFLLTAILIKLSSHGPVFFTQVRLGVNKRRFRMYKFRTMVPDAEKRQAEMEKFNEVDGPAFKIKDDPRLTPVGKLLRKTSIDELPQLLNVLLGDMSLVGPRPLPVRDYERFDKDWHRRRFSVRPGITCLWQISGRNGIAFEKWMELDMKYIDNWSILLDIVILTKTIPAVIKGKGAE